MVQVGQIYRLKSLSKSNLFAYVIEVSRSAKNVLAAFVSEDTTPNCSHIRLTECLYLYPSIQGNISTHSFGKKKMLDEDQLENSEYIRELARHWPALTSNEKEESSAELKGKLTLGDSLLDFSADFLNEFEDFSNLSFGYHQSMQLGVQIHEDVLSQILKENIEIPAYFHLTSNAALFASNSISKVLRETNSFHTSDLKRFAIRRAAELKSKRKEKLLWVKDSGYAAYFDFMKLFELPGMTIARSDYSSERKSRSYSQGPFTLTIIQI